MLYSGIHQIKVTGEEYWELINVPHDIIIPLFLTRVLKMRGSVKFLGINKLRKYLKRKCGTLDAN
jgi:hypothetical protein